MAGSCIRCVTFDLDDTLYLEREYVRSGFDAVGLWTKDRLGIEDFSARAWAAFEAGVRGSIFDAALVSAGVEPDPETIKELVVVYRAHTPLIRPLPDATACVTSIIGQALLAVVSDGPLESQRAKANVLGVQAWSTLTVLTTELGDGFGKPDPRSFRLVERATSASGDECVYLADNPAKDFGGPRSLGWRTVRVRRRGSLHEKVDSTDEVDAEVQDLSSVVKLLFG